MEALKKCLWRAQIKSCYDDEREQEVYYWQVYDIEGPCGLTHDGINMVPRQNFVSKEAAAANFEEFRTVNDIRNYKLEYSRNKYCPEHIKEMVKEYQRRHPAKKRAAAGQEVNERGKVPDCPDIPPAPPPGTRKAKKAVKPYGRRNRNSSTPAPLPGKNIGLLETLPKALGEYEDLICGITIHLEHDEQITIERDG